jgi:uncharacterized membrane protein
MEATYRRSLAKAVSWRVFGSLATVLLVFLLTGRIEIALATGGLEFVSKVFIYFVHERIWDAVPWGLKGSRLEGSAGTDEEPLMRLKVASSGAGSTGLVDRQAL